MNKQYNKFLLIFCICASSSLCSYTQQVIASSGSYYSNSAGSLSVTIGESVVTTLSNGSINLILTQGFQQSSNESILPLKLIAFNAKKENGSVLLQWKTINEVDIEHFSVLRSSNGINFEKLDTVAAKNNPALENNYQFLDPNAGSKTVYYKLLITEKNGDTKYSWIVSISNRSEVIKIYPVPAKSTLTIEINETSDTKKQVQLYDLSGKLLFTQSYSLIAGNNRLNINIAHLPQGTYLLNGLTDTAIKIIKEN